MHVNTVEPGTKKHPLSDIVASTSAGITDVDRSVLVSGAKVIRRI